MIKHFCDICKNEMAERIRVSITAKEVCGESYLQTVGEKLMMLLVKRNRLPYLINLES